MHLRCGEPTQRLLAVREVEEAFDLSIHPKAFDEMRDRFDALALLFQVVPALELSPRRGRIGDIGERVSRRKKNEAGEKKVSETHQDFQRARPLLTPELPGTTVSPR